MAATGFTRSGGMYYHPILKRWAHNPLHVAKTAIKAGNLALNVGQGNFMTRNFRQKPIVGLQTAKHKKTVAVVEFPATTGRRTKNNLLTTNKAMPYKRSYRKRTFRKRGGRRRRTRKSRLPPLVLPRSKMVRFRMVVPAQLSGASGAIATYPFKANSLNDPSGTITQQLPLGLDQWASQYQKYIVLGSKIIVRASPVANTGSGVVGIHLDDDTTALTTSSHYKELPLTKQCLVTTNNDLKTISMKYSGKRFWKLQSLKDDSEQEASFSTTPGDPTDIAYFIVYLQDLVGANTFTVDVQVEVEYICLLTEPVTLAQSAL